MSIVHPLPVGTRVYYEDLDGGDCVILMNDNTTAEFADAVATFNRECHTDCPPSDVDYIVQFDDLTGVTPIQSSGVLRVL
jgi:hypothetical protein